MSKSSRRTAIAVAVTAALLFGSVAHADPQRRQDRNASAPAAKPVEMYPDSPRKSPDFKVPAKTSKQLQQLVELYDEEKGAEVRALADALIAAESNNPYVRSFAAQMGANAAYDADAAADAIQYLNHAITFNGLDNNAHFQLMMMLAQLQMQEEQYPQALATLDRFFTETASKNPDHLAAKGQLLYEMERYPEAIELMKSVIASSPDPKSQWTQVLMASYFEAGQAAEAATLAEQLAAKNPGNKQVQMNLANAYLQADALEKSAEVMDKLATAGLLTEEKEYRQLYSTYLNIEGREKDAVRVIQEGLAKGVLKPEFPTYLALAQSYYFAEQIEPAIDAYRKAAPLAADGETYLNLARLLWQEGRISEAKTAARQALAKGVKKPGDAQKIVALPGG